MEELLKAAGVLADLGGTVIVTAMLYLVWLRLNTVTDRMVEILTEVIAQRKDNEPLSPRD